LDTLLDDLPVQHREVEGFESELFHTYFPNGIRLLAGGIETGFHHVAPESYSPRLLHLRGNFKSITCNEVPLSHKSLNSGDVYIVDLGLKLIQWNGSKSNGAERIKAAQLVRAIEEERNGHPRVEVISEGEQHEEFWATLGGEGPIAPDFQPSVTLTVREPVLNRLSDSSGKFAFNEVGRGRLTKRLLASDDVFILDTGAQIYAWIGKQTTPNERKFAVQYAQEYLHNHNLPPQTPITRILEGGENEVFQISFAA